MLHGTVTTKQTDRVKMLMTFNMESVAKAKHDGLVKMLDFYFRRHDTVSEAIETLKLDEKIFAALRHLINEHNDCCNVIPIANE